MRIGMYEHYMHGRDFGRSAWSIVDRGPSQGNLSARGRSGGRGADKTGHTTGRGKSGRRAADHAIRHDSRLSKADHNQVAKEAGRQKGPQGLSSSSTATHRPTPRTSTGFVPALPGPIETLPGNPHAIHRRHSRGDNSGCDRTHYMRHGPRVVEHFWALLLFWNENLRAAVRETRRSCSLSPSRGDLPKSGHDCRASSKSCRESHFEHFAEHCFQVETLSDDRIRGELFKELLSVGRILVVLLHTRKIYPV